MSIKKSILALAGTLFLILPAHQAFAHEAHCEIKETQLGDIMKYMKSELRAYTRGVNSDDSTKMQKHLNELLMLSEKAELYTPVVINQMTHSQVEVITMKGGQADQHSLYLQQIKQLNNTFKKLNETMDKNEIKSILKDIKKQRNQGHKQFRQDC